MGKDLRGKELGAGLQQRKDGKYAARLTNRDGRRLEKHFDKLTEAKRWLTETRYENTHENAVMSNSFTVDVWFDYWIKEIIGGRTRYNTQQYYIGRYEHRISPIIGKMRLDEVKALHCQAVMNHAMKENDATSSETKIRSIMKMMFDAAVKNELVVSNPVTKSVRFEKKEPAERRVLTKPEQKEFLAVGQDNEHYDEFVFVLNTGLRCGELSALRWEDIDWKARTITVRGTMYYKNDTKHFEVNPPKTKAGVRTVPLTQAAYDILVARRRNRGKIISFQYGEYVFLNQLGKPTRTTVYNKSLKLITGQLGIEHFSMHSLRHTFATRCIESGMKPKVLQKILGHSNITMTMNLYVHVTEDEAACEIQMVEQAFA